MKGQTQLIFGFILAAVVIGMIMLFGFSGTQKVLEASEETARVVFLSELRNDIKNYETLRGSSKLITYQVPGYVDEVCFCSDVGCLNDTTRLTHGIIQNYEDENVFLFDGGQVILAENMGNVVSPELKCFANTGRIKIRLTGLGNGVTVQ